MPQQVVARHNPSAMGDAQKLHVARAGVENGRVLKQKGELKGGKPPSPQDRQWEL